MPVGSAALAFILAVAAIAILVGAPVVIYNNLVRLQNNVAKAWANIDVLLKQRNDEVPNLVAVVKGYAADAAGSIA